MTTTMRRLTEYSHGGGCACKLPQSMLDDVVTMMRQTGVPQSDKSELLIGLDTPDDAAVYAIDDTKAWIVTTDFLTPLVDDPRDWGRIAATNALSDVYAMGGRPLIALNILAWPTDLGADMLNKVLQGGADAVSAAGALVVGGHSITDPIPKYGLVAIGEVERDKILTKGGAHPGDLLVLTKPIGVGIISTAIKRGQAPQDSRTAAVASMTRLNSSASRIASEAGVKAATDITGYGLIGHLHEMAAAAGLGAHVDIDRVPLLPGVTALIADGCAPDGSRRTLANALWKGWFEPSSLPQEQQILLADAQTSGGLLLAVPPHNAASVVAALHAGGDAHACVIGEFVDDGRPGVVTAEKSTR